MVGVGVWGRLVGASPVKLLKSWGLEDSTPATHYSENRLAGVENIWLPLHATTAPAFHEGFNLAA